MLAARKLTRSAEQTTTNKVQPHDEFIYCFAVRRDKMLVRNQQTQEQTE
jgi:hypothetical protein